MRKVQNYTSLVMIFILLIILFSSCTSDERSKAKVSKPQTGKQEVKLRFINSWGGVDSKADTLQQVLNKFMEDNPNIEVVNESMFGEDFLPKLKTDFASGNEPDVFGLWPGSDIRSLIRAGKVAELTDILNQDKQWKDSFGQSAWSYTTFNGKIYGVPLEIIYEGLFVNTDLFNKYKIKIPQTYDDLKTAVVEFKKHKIIPIAYNSQAEGTFLYQNIIAMLGTKSEIENPFKYNKVSSCYLEAMKCVKELNKLKAFPPDAYTLTSKERNDLFKTKKAAMIVQGSWFIGDLKDNEDTVDILPFPSMDNSGNKEGKLIYGLGGGTFYMSKASSNDKIKKDASVLLLKALTSRDTAVKFAEQTGMLSNVDITGSSAYDSRLAKMGIGLLKNSKELIGPPDSFVYRPSWEDIIVKKFPYVLEGRLSVESLWNEAMLESKDFN